jgi:transposase
MKVPRAGKHRRFTLAFEALAIKVLQACRSVKAACQLLKIHWDAAQEIMERAVKRGEVRRVWDKLKAAGLDENSSHQGQSHVSVMLDLGPDGTAHLTTGYCSLALGIVWHGVHAQQFFAQWYHAAKPSRLEPIERVETLKNHLHGILTDIPDQITNGVPEALSRSIQALKSAARGFRSFENSRICILFFLGRLDLHPL